MSFKLTPFLRQTQNQVENFYINYVTGLTSGLNAGNQTSSGFEFQFDKGDFNRNGFSGQLSFAYTYATVKYSTLPNGTTIISPINAGISQIQRLYAGLRAGRQRRTENAVRRSRSAARRPTRLKARRRLLHAKAARPTPNCAGRRHRKSVLAFAGVFALRSRRRRTCRTRPFPVRSGPASTPTTTRTSRR